MNPPESTLFPALIEGGREGPAITHQDRTFTYADLRRETRRLAGRLHEAGVRSGDRVLMLFPNAPEHVVALLASTALGAVAVPVDADTGPSRLRYVLDVIEPRRIVAGEAVTPSLEVKLLRYRLPEPAGSEDNSAPPPELPAPPPSPDAPALILFSSGSTGQPKGVVLTHAQLLWTSAALVRHFRLRPGHRELVVCPLTHSGAWQRVAATLRMGGCLHLADGLLSVAGVLDDVATHSLQGFYTPPPLIRMLLRDDPAKVRRGLAGCAGLEIGSAAIGADELRQLLDLLPDTRVYVHYGMTEVSRAFILDAREHPDKLATVGRPNGVEVEIRDPEGRALPVGQPGEIALRGPQQARGYWRPPSGSQREFIDGWLRTGDCGVLDEEGFLTFLGRVDDLISSAGHHFYPAEVEAELGAVEGVKEYLIAGVPDPRGVLGQVPWAFVVPEPADGWSSKTFMATARRRLQAHLVPRWVVVIPALPLTASGKPDRRRAVEQFGPPTTATINPTARS